MIRSIRHFLLVSLLISITIASSITAIGNYLLDKQVIQPYLDEQLTKMYSFIEILNDSSRTQASLQKIIDQHFSSAKTYLLFAVWDKNGRLLLHSSTYPLDYHNLMQLLEILPS